MEEVRFGVQEALVKEPDLDLLRLEIGDQVLDQLQRLLGEGLCFEVAFEPGLKSIRIHLQPQVGPRLWIGAEEETKSPELMKPVREDSVTTDRDVGGGDVERPVDALFEDLVQHVGEATAQVIDDERKTHELGGNRDSWPSAWATIRSAVAWKSARCFIRSKVWAPVFCSSQSIKTDSPLSPSGEAR